MSPVVTTGVRPPTDRPGVHNPKEWYEIVQRKTSKKKEVNPKEKKTTQPSAETKDGESVNKKEG